MYRPGVQLGTAGYRVRGSDSSVASPQQVRGVALGGVPEKQGNFKTSSVRPTYPTAALATAPRHLQTSIAQSSCIRYTTCIYLCRELKSKRNNRNIVNCSLLKANKHLEVLLFTATVTEETDHQWI